MTRYVIIPARPGFEAAELFVRISTPVTHEACEIDQAYPTVLFLPTLWTDSFFFYPQFDDPAFYEHYNLVAVDLRGYGLSKIAIRHAEYTWKAAADDIHFALTALNITSAHIIAVTFSSLSAIHFAALHPNMTKSLCLITPPQKEEPFLWTMAFDECRAAMLRALEHNDQESLDAITVAAWEFSSGSFQSPALSELRAETLQLQRAKLLNGEVRSLRIRVKRQLRLAAAYLDDLLADRRPHFDSSVASKIKCPVLILYGTEDGCQSPDEDDKLIPDINSNGHPNAKAALQVIEGVPRWMTLTSPNIINPILTSFINPETTQAQPSMPETPTFNRSISRRPSTPRSPSCPFTPVLPKKSPLRGSRSGVKEVGEGNLDENTSSGHGSAGKEVDDGIHLTVEVTVFGDT